nr:uncharacterized protein LOC123281063 [Equus asinus]
MRRGVGARELSVSVGPRMRGWRRLASVRMRVTEGRRCCSASVRVRVVGAKRGRAEKRERGPLWRFQVDGDRIDGTVGHPAGVGELLGVGEGVTSQTGCRTVSNQGFLVLCCKPVCCRHLCHEYFRCITTWPYGNFAVKDKNHEK